MLGKGCNQVSIALLSAWRINEYTSAGMTGGLIVKGVGVAKYVK
jgi:hypothetical protein